MSRTTARLAIISKLALVSLSALALSSCARQSSIAVTSTKLNAYHPNIQRLLIITDLGDTLKYRHDADKAFVANMSNALGSCGIVFEIHQHDPLALENEEQAAFKSLSPDTVLTLVWKSAHTQNGILMGAVLQGSIVDVGSKRQVWKADINFAPAFYAGETMAAAIIGRLKQETILRPDCQTPVVPKV